MRININVSINIDHVTDSIIAIRIMTVVIVMVVEAAVVAVVVVDIRAFLEIIIANTRVISLPVSLSKSKFM